VITVNNIDGSIAGHIHTGGSGVAGDVLVPLFGDASDDKTLKGCVKDVSADTIRSITGNPKGFYVNVHNVDYPNGAIRGQLRK
jgi:hypothetical protein